MSSMITVEEALRRTLASAETPLEEEKVALDKAYGRVLGARPQGAAHPAAVSQFRHGRLRFARRRHGLAAGDAEGDRRVGRRTRVRRRAGSGRGGAHLHRRAHAGRRRRHRHSGGRRARGRAHPSFGHRVGARQSPPGRHGLPGGRAPALGWPPSHSPRCRAGGRRQPRRAWRAPARPGRDPGDRRRTGCARRRAGARADHRLQQFRRRRGLSRRAEASRSISGSRSTSSAR